MQQRADAHEQEDLRRRQVRPEEAVGERGEADDRSSARAERRGTCAKRPGGRTEPSRTAAIGGTRVARSAGRKLARTVTTIPTSSATTIVRGFRSSPLFGSVNPTAEKSANSPLASAEPEEEPDHRGEHADDSRLDQHAAQYLAPGGTERPQRGELSRPLRDRDRERVRDHERADEQGDAAEGEQEALQEAGEALRVACVLRRLVLAGAYLGVGREDAADRLEQLLLARRPGLARPGSGRACPPCGRAAVRCRCRIRRASRRRSTRRRRT